MTSKPPLIHGGVAPFKSSTAPFKMLIRIFTALDLLFLIGEGFINSGVIIDAQKPCLTARVTSNLIGTPCELAASAASKLILRLRTPANWPPFQSLY